MCVDTESDWRPIIKWTESRLRSTRYSIIPPVFHREGICMDGYCLEGYEIILLVALVSKAAVGRGEFVFNTLLLGFLQQASTK